MSNKRCLNKSNYLRYNYTDTSYFFLIMNCQLTCICIEIYNSKRTKLCTQKLILREKCLNIITLASFYSFLTKQCRIKYGMINFGIVYFDYVASCNAYILNNSLPTNVKPKKCHKLNLKTWSITHNKNKIFIYLYIPVLYQNTGITYQKFNYPYTQIFSIFLNTLIHLVLCKQNIHKKKKSN